MTRLRGIVMCGGQSKRMGTDKGLIAIADTCWAAYMGDKLTLINLQVNISVNQSQPNSYQKIFRAKQLIVDELAIVGPLNGLLSAHVKYPGNDLLLLACDMVNMQSETLKRLIDTYNREPGYDFYVYQNKYYAEPFCGIYTARGLVKLKQKLELLNATNWGFQKVLNDGNTRRLQIIEISSFDNYNTRP